MSRELNSLYELPCGCRLRDRVFWVFCPLHENAQRMLTLIETSLRAGRFPETGDGCELWAPAQAARNMVKDAKEGK